MAIALARRGGTKCRKNSPQVTVFSQSGEATCCEREGKTYLRTRPPQILARGGSPPRNPPHQKRKQSYTITRILARRGSLSCLRGLRAERERHTNRNYPCGTVYIFPKVCYNTKNATAKTENKKRRITATKNRRRKAHGNRKTTRRGQTVRRGRRNPGMRRIIPKESR